MTYAATSGIEKLKGTVLTLTNKRLTAKTNSTRWLLLLGGRLKASCRRCRSLDWRLGGIVLVRLH